MVQSKSLFSDCQRVVQQIGCFFVLVLISTERDKEVRLSAEEKTLTWQSRTHLYTSANMFSMVATSGWVWPDDFSRSSRACGDISSSVHTIGPGSFAFVAAPPPVCRAVLPPRIGPGTRTGSPGCAAFEGGPESRSRPAGRRRLRCCDEAETLRKEKEKVCLAEGRAE